MTPNWSDSTFRYCIFANYGMFYSNFLRSLSESFDFLDIGANQGLYSLIAAKNPCCRSVHAFEPVERVARTIESNARLNAVEQIHVHIAAVSDSEGRRLVLLNPAHTGGTHIARSEGRADLENPDATGAETQEVTCVSTSFLDSILRSGSPSVHVKIDVEGHEREVIEALLACKNFQKVRSIMYEVDHRWIDPEPIRHKLIEFGFDSFTQVGKGFHYDVLAERRGGAQKNAK